MGRNRTNREGATLSEQQKKPVSPVERANSSDRQIWSEALSSFQTALVSVNFNEKPILVSRRSFSEIVKWRLLEIIYTTTHNTDKKTVFVSFKPHNQNLQNPKFSIF